jgi:di/tricarboxylate transporter
VKKRFLWLGLAAIALGVAVLLYRGPGRAVIRGHVGDVAATMLVYATLGAIWWRSRMLVRAVLALAIATAIEIGQLFWSTDSFAGELTIGDTCDPWDIVAYVIGVGIAVVWERIAVARCAACAPPSS